MEPSNWHRNIVLATKKCCNSSGHDKTGFFATTLAAISKPPIPTRAGHHLLVRNSARTSIIRERERNRPHRFEVLIHGVSVMFTGSNIFSFEIAQFCPPRFDAVKLFLRVSQSGQRNNGRRDKSLARPICKGLAGHNSSDPCSLLFIRILLASETSRVIVFSLDETKV